MKLYYTVSKLDLSKLTVFKNAKSHIISEMIRKLNKLMSSYRLDTIYDSSDRSVFYFKRSQILGSNAYFLNDKKLNKTLEKFKIHYISGKKFDSKRKVFILEIDGYSSFNLYKEASYFSLYTKYDLLKNLEDHRFKI